MRSIRSRTQEVFDPWRILAALVWAVPLALLLFERSPWAIVPAAAMGWQIAKAIRASLATWDRAGAVPLFLALTAAVSLQSGALTGVLGWPIASAAWFGVGSMLVALSSSQIRTALVGKKGSSRPAARAAVLALMFTLAGLVPYLLGGGGDSEAAGRGPGNEPQKSSAKEPGHLGGSFRGVILLTEPLDHTIVPPPPDVKREASRAKPANPFSIPFFGVYWMFRFPQREPPPGSYVTRGSPLKSVFRTPDRFPLTEEARQNFGAPIQLNCCRTIQIAVTNVDPLWRYLSLELVLRDTALPGKPAVSLGEQMVGTGPDWMRDEHAGPVEAVLSYDVPAGAKIREFDEATIRFRLRGPVSGASSKVEIERFVFVPRGF